MARATFYGTLAGVKQEVQKALRIGVASSSNLFVNIEESDVTSFWLPQTSDQIDSELSWLYRTPLTQEFQSAEESAAKRYPFPIDEIANKWAAGEIIRAKYADQAEINASQLAQPLMNEGWEYLHKILAREIRLKGQRIRSTTTLYKAANEKAALELGLLDRGIARHTTGGRNIRGT